jgi:hypothetical protein
MKRFASLSLFLCLALALDAQTVIVSAGGGGGSGGVTTLNTLTNASQTFATGTSGTDFAIVSAAGAHTFNMPDASATARGVVTTGAQTIAGNKTFNGKIIGGTALSLEVPLASFVEVYPTGNNGTFPVGSFTSPILQLGHFAGGVQNGLWITSTQGLAVTRGGSANTTTVLNAGSCCNVEVSRSGGFVWSATADTADSSGVERPVDTGITRRAAGIVGVGDGGAAPIGGRVYAAQFGTGSLATNIAWAQDSATSWQAISGDGCCGESVHVRNAIMDETGYFFGTDVGFRHWSYPGEGSSSGVAFTLGPNGTYLEAGDIWARRLRLTGNLNGFAKPTCTVDYRGSIFYTNAASGTADATEICAKDASDAYAWRTTARTDAAQTFNGAQTFAGQILANNGIVGIGYGITGFATSVNARTTGLTLDVDALGAVMTNEGAAGPITITLRTAFAGANYGFIDNNSGANRLTVKPNTGDQLIWTDGTVISAATGSVVSTARYNSFACIGVDADTYVVTHATGTWSLTP